MDEIILREYLRNKGRGMSDDDFMRKLKEHFETEKFARGRGRGRGMRRDSERGEFFEEDFKDIRDPYEMYEDFYFNRHSPKGEFIEQMKYMDHEDKKRLMEMMLEGNEGEHFNESYAKYTVSQMYHTENGRKYVGEKFDMSKAKDVCERYRGIIPQSVTHADVYVAINAQYHDYCELFKAWFGDNIDTKIIESAINFWFKDDDYKGGCKIWKYFKEA